MIRARMGVLGWKSEGLGPFLFSFALSGISSKFFSFFFLSFCKVLVFGLMNVSKMAVGLQMPSTMCPVSSLFHPQPPRSKLAPCI